MQGRRMADDHPNSVGNVIAASLPAALGLGLFAIAALLINLQVQSARVEATITQLAQSVNEIKNDTKAQWTELDQRVRALEMRK